MRFTYRAVEAGGQLREGEINATSREGAVARLRGRDLVPVSLKPSEDAAHPGAADRRALREFTREFEALVGADIRISRGLAMLADTAALPQVREIARSLLAEVQKGTRISAAMAAQPGVFPAHYVGMVQAGEESGTLASVLTRLSDMLERDAALRARVQSALIYPLVVLFLTCLTLLLLLIHVIPEFRTVFEQGGIEPPLTTRIVLAASDMAVEFGWFAVVGLLALWLLIRRAGRGAGRVVRDRLLLRLPLFGPLARKIETARYARTLGTLVENGVLLVDAARIATGTMTNASLRHANAAMVRALARGDSVVEAVDRAGWLAPRSRQMIAVGVESGRLGEMLLKLADIEETESERSIQRLVGLIAPAATVILGCIIAFMIGSILSAILGSYDLAV